VHGGGPSEAAQGYHTTDTAIPGGPVLGLELRAGPEGGRNGAVMAALMAALMRGLGPAL